MVLWLRLLLRRPPLFQCRHNCCAAGGAELAFSFLRRRLLIRTVLKRRPPLTLCVGDCFAPSSTHFSPRLSGINCGVTVTCSHGFKFSNLRIDAALLFLKAKDRSVDYLVREFWNCHYVVHSPTFWHDPVSGLFTELCNPRQNRWRRAHADRKDFQNCLAFPQHQRDESSCADQPPKGSTS